jgi:hypothetical protein
MYLAINDALDQSISMLKYSYHIIVELSVEALLLVVVWQVETIEDGLDD